MSANTQQQVELWLESIPKEVLDAVRDLGVMEAGFGAGPGCCAGKVEQFGAAVTIAEGLRWIADYAHVLKAAHLRLTDGSVLWFRRSEFMRWAPGEQSPPRPGLVVRHK